MTENRDALSATTRLLLRRGNLPASAASWHVRLTTCQHPRHPGMFRPQLANIGGILACSARNLPTSAASWHVPPATCQHRRHPGMFGSQLANIGGILACSALNL